MRPHHYVADLPAPQRTLVMGVVNVTPDSFSDGGLWLEPKDAIAHGLRLAEQGADIVDVGGESTRPGAARPAQAEELRRVAPVVRELTKAGALVSIDTMRSEVAESALAEGARLVNDVSGGLADPDMLRVVADAQVPIVLTHWRAHSKQMQREATYDDVVAEVADGLCERADAAVKAGITPERIAIDPGLGFAKTADHNWSLLSDLPKLTDLGFPVLIGASRKRFLGALLADSATGTPRPPHERDAATHALSAFAALCGVWAVRVHAVEPTLDAVRVVARVGSGPWHR